MAGNHAPLHTGRVGGKRFVFGEHREGLLNRCHTMRRISSSSSSCSGLKSLPLT